jgi:hypothetical protein
VHLCHKTDLKLIKRSHGEYYIVDGQLVAFDTTIRADTIAIATWSIRCEQKHPCADTRSGPEVNAAQHAKSLWSRRKAQMQAVKKCP